jgi:hypothetical protein
MKTTEWQPISLIELKVMVEDAIEEFPVELRQQFRAMHERYVQIDCKRSESFTPEKMYAVMIKGQDLLLFDDVEDEFCVAKLPEARQLLADWVLFPDLSSAFREFIKESKC